MFEGHTRPIEEDENLQSINSTLNATKNSRKWNRFQHNLRYLQSVVTSLLDVNIFLISLCGNELKLHACRNDQKMKQNAQKIPFQILFCILSFSPSFSRLTIARFSIVLAMRYFEKKTGQQHNAGKKISL